MAEIQFLGAAGSVTGSRHLLHGDDGGVLVDCGLFQGEKKLRLRNWDRFPVELDTIRHVLLTHAHIDHTGYLPRIVRDGYRGKILATKATADLVEIMLPDSGRLQEEDAAYHNKKGTSKHKPALPLYTEDDARRAAARVEGVSYQKLVSIGGKSTATFRRAGHIMGSAHVTVELRNGGSPCRVLFSGDVGRYDSPLLPDPVEIGEVDYLLVESTYGDRVRDDSSIPDQLARVVNEVVEKKGALIIPAFAVGRTQEMMYYLGTLEEEGRIPKLPTFVDSPTAINVTEVYCEHPQDFDRDLREDVASGDCPLENENFRLTRTPAESKKINDVKGPVIIISASGMITGGRILHHLMHRLPDSSTTVLLVGYQAYGTRGRRLQNGEEMLRIFGKQVPVRAQVETLSGLSAHADADDLMRWLGTATRAPKRVFLVHGEPDAAGALSRRIEKELGWATTVPDYGDRVTLE